MTACASCRASTATRSVAKVLTAPRDPPVPPGPTILEIALNTSTSSLSTSIISPHHDRLQGLVTRAVPWVIWQSHLSRPRSLRHVGSACRCLISTYTGFTVLIDFPNGGFTDRLASLEYSKSLKNRTLADTAKTVGNYTRIRFFVFLFSFPSAYTTNFTNHNYTKG